MIRSVASLRYECRAACSSRYSGQSVWSTKDRGARVLPVKQGKNRRHLICSQQVRPVHDRKLQGETGRLSPDTIPCRVEDHSGPAYNATLPACFLFCAGYSIRKTMPNPCIERNSTLFSFCFIGSPRRAFSF